VATVSRDDRLAGRDADPDVEVQVGLALVQLLDGSKDGQRGPHRPLGVVLVGDRGAEYCHHPVANKFVQGSPEPFDLVAQPSMVGAKQCPDVLRVGMVEAGGKADQVAEQHGDDPALLHIGSGGYWGAAAATEGKPSRDVGTTGWAAQHGG
jgi:hypothetical protein